MESMWAQSRDACDSRASTIALADAKWPFLLSTVLDPCAPNVRRRCVHFHRSLLFAVVVVGSERKQGGLMPSDTTRPRKRKASFDLI